MKPIYSFICLLTLGISIVSSSAFADPVESGAWQKRADLNGDGVLSDDERERAKRLFERLDRNGDGQLDERERQHAREIKKRIDLNGDGKIDEEERAQAKRKRAELRAKIDADGDGEISEAEKRAAREKWQQHKEHHGGSPSNSRAAPADRS